MTVSGPDAPQSAAPAGLTETLQAGPGWPADPTPPTGPLAGVRVLDLSRVLAGPYCCLVLADLGADVLKVERPGAGDDTRRWGPPFHGDDAAYFFSVNRDRRSVALDLTTEAGRAVVGRLVATADVVVENFLPRHLARLGPGGAAGDLDRGLGVGAGRRRRRPGGRPAGLRRDGAGTQRPDVGQRRRARRPRSVSPSSTSSAGCTPRSARWPACSPAGPAGRRCGSRWGCWRRPCRCSSTRRPTPWSAGVVPGPTGNDHPNLAPYGPVACADTALVVGAGNDAQFAQLCRAVGLVPPPRWATNAGRVADRAALSAALADVFGTRPAREWVPLLAAAGVPSRARAGPRHAPGRPADAGERPARRRSPHPAGDVRVVGSPYRLDGVRPRVRRAPPLLGQHTVEVLAGARPVGAADRGGDRCRPEVRRWSPRCAPGRRGGLRAAGGAQPGRLEGVPRLRRPAGRRAARADRRLRRRRLRPGDRPARRRADDDRAGRRQRRRRDRRGVGRALARCSCIATDIPTDRAPARARTAACCTRRPTRRPSSARSPRRSCGSSPPTTCTTTVRARRTARAAAPAPAGVRRGARPTCCRRRPRCRGVPAGSRAPPRCPTSPTALAALLAAARRPLLWAGGGATAADAGRAGRRRSPSGSARRCCTSYGGRGLLPPEHPLPGAAAAARARRPGRCGTPPTSSSCSAATSTP